MAGEEDSIPLSEYGGDGQEHPNVRIAAARAGHEIPSEGTIGQEHGVATARESAGVHQLEIRGETLDYHEEVGVHDRRTGVRDVIDALLPLAETVDLSQDRVQLVGYIIELKACITPGKRIID